MEDFREKMIIDTIKHNANIEGICYVSLKFICDMNGRSTDRHKGTFLDYTKRYIKQCVDSGYMIQVYGKPIDQISIIDMIGLKFNED